MKKFTSDGKAEQIKKAIEEVSIGDVRKFEKFMEEFYIEKTLTVFSKDTIRIYDVPKAMEAYGATKEGGVVFGTYNRFWNLMEVLGKLKERREYAKKKELEGLEDLAKSMRIEK